MNNPIVNQKSLIIALVAVVILGTVAFIWFSRGYGEVSSRGYQHATALFSACNRRDTETVKELQTLIEQDVQAGQLHSQEAVWLDGIVDEALDDNWKRANQLVRRLMEDQARPAE